MTTASEKRQLVPWSVAILLSVIAAIGITELIRLSLEHDYRENLVTEVKRRALDVTLNTMNGNVMGAVATLGLANHLIKSDASREVALNTSSVIEVLQTVGNAFQANGVFVVGANGIIRSSWAGMGKPNTGLDVRFRPYFRMAMQGKQNVYAAIGTSNGLRSLYFAAPLYSESSSASNVIGATVARLDIERINSVLKSWPGPALLMSPQQISFASNREDWVDLMSGEVTQGQLREIRELKQFGKTFESGTPKRLPFDVEHDTVSFDNHRYAVSRGIVQWNDPQGDWSLVFLADLDSLMPMTRRLAIGALSAAVMLVLSALLLGWRRHLNNTDEQRQRAEAELREHAVKLESDSLIKSYLARLSADLHQAVSSAEFARKFMFHVVPRVEADYGEFYIVDMESGRLDPAGGYGALSTELEAVAIGQGLVGQCAKDMMPIEFFEPVGTNIRIVWGEGEAEPKSVLLLPVVQAGRILGVVVLASLKTIDSEKRALLDEMLPMVAMNLEILERNLGTQRQSEILKEQKTSLQETETWYRGIIESAPDGMLVADEQGTIILANPKIEMMFGYRIDGLAGKAVEDLMHVDVRVHFTELRDNHMQDGMTRALGASDEVFRGVRQDGSEFPMDLGGSRLPALNGHGQCVCVSVRDITERKQAENELKERMEDLERFSRLTVSREEKMIELKKEINSLHEQMGQQKKYVIVE